MLDVFSDVYKNNDIDFKNLCIGSELWTGAHNGFTGYLKDLKIYKGVAVVPESPVGKIQLDFDNNLALTNITILLGLIMVLLLIK